MTMGKAKANTDVDKHDQGFRKIAWAFLKVMYEFLFFRTQTPLLLFYFNVFNIIFCFVFPHFQLVGTNGVLNIDSKLRLQLFCPLPRAKRQLKTIEVVEWWRKYPRTKYASTLYVTVKGIKLPAHVS